MHGNQDGIEPSFADGIIEDGILYAFDNRIKSMCEVNLSDMSMQICANCTLTMPIYAKRIFPFRRSLIMQLGQCSDILLFDRETKTFSYYESSQSREIAYNLIHANNGILFLPLIWGENLVFFDEDRREYIDYIIEDASNIDKESIVLRPFSIDGEIIFPSQSDSTFYCLDYKKRKIVRKSLITKQIIPYLAAYDGKEFWIIEKQADRLYRCGNQSQTIDIPEGDYGNVAVLSMHVCLMPRGNEELLIVSKNGGEVISVEIEDFDDKTNNNDDSQIGTKYVYFVEDEKRIYFFPNGERKMFMFDKQHYTTEIFTVYCDEYKRQWKDTLFGSGRVLMESKNIGLRELTDML